MKWSVLPFVFVVHILCSYGKTTCPPDSIKTKAKLLNPKKAILKEIGPLPKILKEASGLEFTGRYFWSHNDDGIPALYCFDSTAGFIRAIQLNSINRGWEDLTSDEEGNLFIGAFGNNKNDKKDLRVYKIRNPDTITETITKPEIITYSYSDQKQFPPDKTNRNFDVDAFFALEGALYLFTKNRSSPFSGYSKIYQLPTEPGSRTAELIDSVYVGEGPMINNWITSADLSPDKKTLALLFHDRIWFVRNFKGGRMSGATIYELNLNHYTHKAGLCWRDDRTIYIVDELEANILGGKLYTLDIKSLLNDLKP